MNWTKFYAECSNAELLHYWHDHHEMICKTDTMPSEVLKPKLALMVYLENELDKREAIQKPLFHNKTI